MNSTTLTGGITQERLNLGDLRLYLATAALVIGNVALPALVHGIPNAGRMLVPIFFFTLIAGWRFGITAALLTAILSPLANHALTGMPPTPMLTGIICQSAALGLIAALVAGRSQRTTLPLLALVVLLHQVLLALPILAQAGFQASAAAFQMRLPGLLLQIIGGYLTLRLLERWLPMGQTREG